MGLFKNIIHEKQPEGPDHLILRQSKRVLYRLMLIGVGILLLYLLVLYWGVTFLPSWEALNMLGSLVQGILGTLFLVVLMVLFGYVISLMVNYFYTMYLINDRRVVKVKYGTNFESEVVAVDLTKVIYSNTDQSGMMQSTCNYGDIHLHLVSDDELILENIPKPKECVMEIEALQEYIKNNDKQSSDQKDPAQQDSDSGQSNETNENSDEEGKNKSDSSQEKLEPQEAMKKEIRKEVIAQMKDSIKEQVTKEVKDEIKHEIEEEIAHKLLSN